MVNRFSNPVKKIIYWKRIFVNPSAYLQYRLQNSSFSKKYGDFDSQSMSNGGFFFSYAENL